MKRTILSLLIAGMFAGAGTLAIAQNVTAEDQSPAKSSQTNPSTDSAAGQAKSVDKSGTTSGSQAKSGDDSTNTGDQAKSGVDYNAATTKAQATFTEANAKCDSLQGAEKTTCVSDAETARTKSLAEAEKQWNSQNDQRGKNEAGGQTGDQAESEDGTTASEGRAAATGTNDGQQADQTDQARSQDGMTSPENEPTGLNEDQKTDKTGSNESGAEKSMAPTSAQRGDTQ